MDQFIVRNDSMQIELWDSDRTLGNPKLRTKNRWEGGTQELIKDRRSCEKQKCVSQKPKETRWLR